MTPSVKLTAYDKQTERLVAAATVPANVVTEVRRIAKVPASDTDLRGVYPLTATQVTEIAAKLGARLEADRFDYCLEAILPAPKTSTSSGVPKTKRERARANAARERARGAPQS